MPHDHEIADGTTVTLSPNQRRVAGFWQEDMSDFATVWNERIEQAVHDGQADVVTVGEITESGDIQLDEHQKIKWSSNARIEYDSNADTVTSPDLAPEPNDHSGETITPDRVDASTLAGIATSAKHTIASSESGTIPTNYSQVVAGPMEVNGTLEVDGRLEIL